MPKWFGATFFIVFPNELLQDLWHSTSLERYKQIIHSGAILVEPEIEDSKRWCTGQGKEHYPFVRYIGGVSLFDFKDFDPVQYTKKYPCSSWNSFIPKQRDWVNTVFIKINRVTTKQNIINPADLVKKWKSENEYGHNLMPHIECAHIGDLSSTNFIKTLVYNKNTMKLTTLS